jgi:hypothetical protein
VPRRGGLLGWLRGQGPGGRPAPPAAPDPHAATSKPPPAPGEAPAPPPGDEQALRIDAARARLKARIPPKED